MTSALEVVDWKAEWDVFKWDEDMTRYLTAVLNREPLAQDFRDAHIKPYEISHVDGNLLTTAGVARIHNLITGAGGQAATNTATRIGVGDGVTTATVADTDLSAVAGSTHRQFVVMDATFPSAGTTMTFQSTFTSALGNFAWAEFGIDIGSPTVTNGTTVNALLLNHKSGIAQGTKTAGQSWAALATITIS